MSITKAFRAALTLGVVTAPLALIGCDDSTPATPSTPPTPVAKPAEPAKAPDAAKPATPAPAEKN